MADLQVQDFSIHQGAAAKVRGKGPDGVALSNFLGEVQDGAGIDLRADDDASDDRDELFAGGDVASVTSIKFTADGDDGKKYGAVGRGTIVAPEVQIAAMTLTFEEIPA